MKVRLAFVFWRKEVGARRRYAGGFVAITKSKESIHMKLKKLMAIGGGTLVLATGVFAQKAETEMRYDRDKDRDRELSEPKMAYDRNEFTIDFFAGYSLGESTIRRLNRRNIDRGNWGGGIGVNYFFTRNFGIGGDAF